MANAAPAYRVQRKLRPKQGTPLPDDRLAHVRMVLVEYGHSASQLAGPLAADRKEGASPLAAKLKGMGLDAGGLPEGGSREEHGLRKAQMEAAAASMAEVRRRRVVVPRSSHKTAPLTHSCVGFRWGTRRTCPGARRRTS